MTNITGTANPKIIDASPPTNRAGGLPLASELGGDLPCVRCRYNLKGLSIRSSCPECATPVRATLLAVVDPRASELRPIDHRKLTSLGLIVWAAAACAAAFTAWTIRALEIFGSTQTFSDDTRWLRLATPLLAVVSGVGSMVLIRPHGGIPPRSRVYAAMGAACYLPIAWLLWLTFNHPRFRLAEYPTPSGERAIAGIVLCALLIAALVLLRPNARMLAARSLLMRTGRVDRQTMRAVAAALSLSIAGYLCGLVANQDPRPGLDVVRSIGGLLLLCGWVLFTIGLVGILYDCWLLRGVVAEPPLALEDLLTAHKGTRPSRTWAKTDPGRPA